MVRSVARFAAVLLFAAPACQYSSDEGGSAPEPVACDSTEQPVAPDDTSVGFSADEVLARFGGARQATLEYYAGGTTELTLELVRVGEPVHVTTSVPAGVDPDDVLGPCGESTLRIPLELRFTSADGLFAERIPATWALQGLSDAEQVNEYVAVADLEGGLQVEADELSFVIYLRAAEQSGFVIGVVDDPDGPGSEFNLARFNESTWPQME
mgnify:CR=1 FL=1